MNIVCYYIILKYLKIVYSITIYITNFVYTYSYELC